ncbi:hypothetical protein SCORR_v1c02180 [Spiroplasma corruscae]|uniref:Transmembrane protein n=1 Tax=Spiroplasma corruscae TaxID=216934 RepID=A0A222ENX6_9MOLU|nr:hypothetical protein SCORR_v1c02180 [Spiroplasma corruscae]
MFIINKIFKLIKILILPTIVCIIAFIFINNDKLYDKNNYNLINWITLIGTEIIRVNAFLVCLLIIIFNLQSLKTNKIFNFDHYDYVKWNLNQIFALTITFFWSYTQYDFVSERVISMDIFIVLFISIYSILFLFKQTINLKTFIKGLTYLKAFLFKIFYLVKLFVWSFINIIKILLKKIRKDFIEKLWLISNFNNTSKIKFNTINYGDKYKLVK